MSEDWLKQVKDKLDSYESEVPEGVWEALESQLFPARTRKARIMPWVWSFAAAAAVAFGVFATMRLLDKSGDMVEKTEDNRIAEGPASLPYTKPSSSVNDEGGQASTAQLPVTIVPSPAGRMIAEAVPAEVQPVQDILPVEDAVPVEGAVAEEDIVVAEDIVPETVETKEDKAAVTTSHEGEDWSGYMSADGSDGKSRRRPSLGASFSRAASTTESASTLDSRMFFMGVASTWDNETRSDDINTRTVSTPVNRDEDHKRPVRMSLTVDYPLSNVFSLESGLAYSVLRSTFKTASGVRLSEENQTLGYLGIPLNLKANLLDKDMFTLYLSGGGMVEKCITASSKTSVTVNGEKTGSVSLNTFSVKPLVWSVNGVAGLQVNLPSNFGIYVEPGVSYHFPDNSKVSSIYSDKPFDFILTFGARYSFK